jgi:hypothetical protein
MAFLRRYMKFKNTKDQALDGQAVDVRFMHARIRIFSSCPIFNIQHAACDVAAAKYVKDVVKPRISFLVLHGCRTC